MPHHVEWTQPKINALWDYYARNPAHALQYFARQSGARVLERAKRRVSLAGKNIVDLGCGPAYLAEHLAAQIGHDGWTYTGIDYSETSATEATARLGRYSWFNGVAHVASLPSAVPSQSADVLFCLEVIEHLDGDALTATLDEMRRILKAGGCAVVTTRNNEDIAANQTMCPDCGCVFHPWQHVRSWTAASLREMLRNAGFSRVEVAPANFSLAHAALKNAVRRLLRRQIAQPDLFALVWK